MFRSNKSFTLVEVIVVMGVMGLIMGGLMASLRQVIEGETLLKKMQAVEEETRFIMDTFAQDAEYSELVCASPNECYKPDEDSPEFFAYKIIFNVAEKKSELTLGGGLESKYYYSQSGDDYFMKRELKSASGTDPTTLNNTPLSTMPVYRIRLVQTPDKRNNYFITISMIYKVKIKDQIVLIPVETSAMSRTFEF